MASFNSGLSTASALKQERKEPNDAQVLRSISGRAGTDQNRDARPSDRRHDQLLRFKGGGEAGAQGPEAAQVIAKLRNRMKAAGLPVVYVSDNSGEWHSEKSKLVERTREDGSPVKDTPAPRSGDYFIIKLRFSGFYATNLPVLLPKFGVIRLLSRAWRLTFFASCSRLRMRDYSVWIPEDAVAAGDDERGRWALETMRESMNPEHDQHRKSM